MRSTIATTACIAVLAAAGDIYRDAGAAAFQFLKIDVSARAAALGGTTMLNSGTLSGLSSPAALVSLEGRSVTAGHTGYFGSVMQTCASWTAPVGGARYAVTVNSLHADGLEYRDDIPSSDPVDTFGYWDIALSAALAADLGPVDAGVGAKVMRERIWLSEGLGWALDFSILAHPLPWLDAGASLTNVGPAVSFETDRDFRLPMTWRAGARASLVLPVAGEASITVEAGKPLDNRPSGGAGLEVRPFGWVALRTGLRAGGDSHDFTAGAGLSAGGWRLDYAWIPGCMSLGDIHRLVLSTAF